MNQENKIYALMACAEDHQKLIDESIREFKKANHSELFRLSAEQNKLHAEHRKVMNDLYELANKTSNANFKKLGLMWFFQTFLVSLCVVIIFAGGVLFFIDHQSDSIVEMNRTIQKLSQKGGEAEILSCPRDDKFYPCVRVMKSWGSYDGGDVFIIDPK